MPWRNAAVACILAAAALFVAGSAAREAGAPVGTGSSAGASGGQVTWRGRELSLPAAGQPSRPLRVPYPILQVLPLRPPGRGEQLLILTAERPSGSQPRRSHLYRLDPHRPGSLVPLSPEPTYNFWAASAGDVDGDGRQELGLCTFSRTVRDPHYARRFFVYGWTPEGDLYPRWRGSRLCRPYLWAQLADVNGDGRAELVSVERGLGGGELLVAYAWNQFGFWGLAESAEYPRLEVLAVATDGVRVRAGAAPESRQTTLKLTPTGWLEQ